MPDHAHLVVEGLDDGAELKRFILRAKQMSGYYYKQRYRTPLWQRYSYEHVLEARSRPRRRRLRAGESGARGSCG